MHGFGIEMITVAGFGVERFQHVGGGIHCSSGTLDTEMVATAMNGDIQTLFNQFEVLVKLPGEGAQSAGIIGFQGELAPGNGSLGVQAVMARKSGGSEYRKAGHPVSLRVGHPGVVNRS